ncbi:methyltransferase domain-containing protein [Candidatus Woesearchaeota archaeon]|nr:methyltransferase domain-containing protein [Candidatus Woesearchaeota archaeon]
MPKILICKQKKETVDGREHIVIKQRRYYVENLNKDFQTAYGIISKKDLNAESGTIVKTDRGKEFIVLDPGYTDEYKELKKLPQTVPLKDIGLIIAETGLDKNSTVVDAGLGSAALAISLARVCKKVTSYEIREDFIKQAKENIDRMGLTNITVKNENISGIKEKNLDLVTLDLGEPWKVVENAAKALKVGGYLVCYAINVPQVEEFVSAVKKNKQLFYEKTVEIIERQWQIEDRKVRPKTVAIGHSGFVTFARKIVK